MSRALLLLLVIVKSYAALETIGSFDQMDDAMRSRLADLLHLDHVGDLRAALKEKQDAIFDKEFMYFHWKMNACTFRIGYLTDCIQDKEAEYFVIEGLSSQLRMLPQKDMISEDMQSILDGLRDNESAFSRMLTMVLLAEHGKMYRYHAGAMHACQKKWMMKDVHNILTLGGLRKAFDEGECFDPYKEEFKQMLKNINFP